MSGLAYWDVGLVPPHNPCGAISDLTFRYVLPGTSIDRPCCVVDSKAMIESGIATGGSLTKEK
jgi:hypothetical protein